MVRLVTFKNIYEISEYFSPPIEQSMAKTFLYVSLVNGLLYLSTASINNQYHMHLLKVQT